MNKSKLLRRVLGAVMALLLLSGCATTPPAGWNGMSGGEIQWSPTPTGEAAQPTDKAEQPVDTDAIPIATDPTDAEPTDAAPEDTLPVADPTLPTADTTPAAVQTPTVEFTIRDADWTNLEWESYSNVYFTLTVPKGWKVEWSGNAQQLGWSVKNASGNVGVYNLDHNYAAKDASMMQMLGMRYSLRYGTVREYFETVYSTTTQSFVVQNAVVPDNKDQLQAARPNTAIRDYQSLYATFVEDNLVGEGIYTAVIMDSPDVIIRGMNYGTWEINCTFTEWSPQGELVNWLPVLSKIAQSFAYTDYYVQEWLGWARAGRPDGTVSESVNDSFDDRDRAETILQEKRSDMLGEYERVIDNETGEIYRAYLGFLDDMGDQDRYSPISDDQYADGYVGYIDRP